MYSGFSQETSILSPHYGRSGEAQTRGLRIPNAARYQLRYTPIVIKLWSCKWSNLWSNTFLTAFFHFPNRPKSARLKGFRRFSLSCGANTVYAPKPRALPTALHPENVTRLACRKPPVCGCRQAFRIFLFVLYHVCFQKSRFFGFFFCVGAVGTDGQKIRCFFVPA